jgi:pimeloyl-ACP methyl ester carboxylesterase
MGDVRLRRGQGRGRTADLPLFRRTLVPTELPAPEGTRRVYRAGRHRPALVALALVAASAVVAPAASAGPGAGPGAGSSAHRPPTCRPSAAPKDQPTFADNPPPAAPSYFAADFPRIIDSRLKVPVGGFGGLHRGAPLHHTPVVFVHGNQADAQNWLAVMLQFQRLAGYSMQEMYAISYNGLGNAGSGAPTSSPTAPDQDYFRQNPSALGNGGHGAADEDEIPDLCRFIEAVQAYTGSQHVDVVTHSLGVTIMRKMLVDYPSLARDVTAFVAIAGANHGTSVCRGLETTWYGCNEIAPGSPWLAALNNHGEAPGPTRWMTVYDGSAGDPLFDPPYDETSPHLAGALNKTYPGQYHNDLRVEPTEVDDYLAFLLLHGQVGGPTAAERHLAARLTRTHPDGRTGTLCGVPKLTGC